MRTKKNEREWVIRKEGSIHVYLRAGFWQHYINRKGHGTTRVSAQSATFAEAYRKAEALADGWDATKVELAALKAAKERAQVTITHAVEKFLLNAQERLGAEGAGTVAQYKVVVGSSKRCPHSLLTWLDSYNTKHTIVYVSQLTVEVLEDWRQSWVMEDSTKKLRWTIAGMFVQFCMDRDWITGKNPHAAVGKLAEVINPGCGVFSDQQWLDFEAHCTGDERAFFSLMRWGGCAIADAVTFNKRNLTGDVLSYHRYKLRRKAQHGWARVTLPPHLVAMLSMLGDEPFRLSPRPVRSACEDWAVRFRSICAAAGITEIETATGTEPPHTHALRDTCAVSLLRKTRDLALVARVLGHSNTIMTEKRYTPFVKALQLQHDELTRLAMADVVTLENMKVEGQTN